jgi:hypothetical protein
MKRMDRDPRKNGRIRRLSAALIALCLLPGTAAAQDFQLHGYLDARLQLTDGDDVSWIDGGLGKARFGDEGDGALQFGGAALAATWQIAPELLAVADLQLNPRNSPDLGVLDAYLRYRPVSTTPWRWSARVGVFFPPISLENDGTAWTSRWTLTPSAINTWVGEELRDFGAEFRLEHRGAGGTLDLGLTFFKNNDPAGELLARRGWALSDVTSAINTRVRQPDVLSALVFSPAPLRFDPFSENDGRIGWHADVSWQTPGGGKFSLLRYDNRADPESFSLDHGRRVFSWHTRFWSLGAEFPVGDFVLLGQLMDGSTSFEPVANLYLDTKFHAGYLMLGWNRGNWRPALRVDMFSLRQLPDFLAAPLSEHGNALTAALSWRPRPWLRVTGELLRIDSQRNQRRLEHLSPHQVETLAQLSVRLLF